MGGFALPSLESRVLEGLAFKPIHQMSFLRGGERGAAEAQFTQLLFDVSHWEIGLLLMISASHH